MTQSNDNFITVLFITVAILSAALHVGHLPPHLPPLPFYIPSQLSLLQLNVLTFSAEELTVT